MHDKRETRLRRSSRATALGAVGATVAAVVAAMILPHWFSTQGEAGPSVPQPSGPSQAPDAPGTRTWQPVKCPRLGVDSCAAPTSLDHAGLLLSRRDGQRLVWHSDPGALASVVTTVARSTADRWVLVGAEHAGSDSRLSVEIGGAAPVTVPPGRLSLFALRGHRAFVLRVADLGTPRDGEVLRIVEYRSSQ